LLAFSGTGKANTQRRHNRREADRIIGQRVDSRNPGESSFFTEPVMFKDLTPAERMIALATGAGIAVVLMSALFFFGVAVMGTW